MDLATLTEEISKGKLPYFFAVFDRVLNTPLYPRGVILFQISSK